MGLALSPLRRWRGRLRGVANSNSEARAVDRIKEGEADRLRLPLCSMFPEHGFTIVYAHIIKLNLETPTGPPALREQAECPDCKGSG
jgi:hypothetical protein